MLHKKQEKMKSSKTKVDADVVMHVAHLAKLNLTKKEAKMYQEDLNSILSAFRDLEKASVDAKPSFHPLDIKDVFRQDKEEECLKREKALANTKHKEDGFFKGPRAV